MMRYVQMFFYILVEYVLFLPYLIVVGIILPNFYTMPEWLLSFFVANLIGIIVKMIFPRQQWWLYGIFVIGFGFLLTYFAADRTITVTILAVLYPIYIYRGVRNATIVSENIISIPILWVGGGLTYFIGYVIFQSIYELREFIPYITVGGLIFIVGTLLISNNEQLKQSTLSDDSSVGVSKTMKKQNKIYLGVTMVIIVLLTFGQFIQNAFMTFSRWVFRILSGKGDPFEMPIEPPSGNSDKPNMDLLPIDEASTFVKFLELFMVISAYVLVAVLVIAIILFLLKRTRGIVVGIGIIIINFLKNLGQKLMGKTEESDDYTEEKENIFDLKEWTAKKKEQVKAIAEKVWRPRPRFRSLTNREKVRFVYRNFILQQPGVKIESDTPRETLDRLTKKLELDPKKVTELREVYEKVRYGEQDVSDEEVEAIHHLIKRRK